MHLSKDEDYFDAAVEVADHRLKEALKDAAILPSDEASRLIEEAKDALFRAQEERRMHATSRTGLH
jgi:hypothetical protein